MKLRFAPHTIIFKFPFTIATGSRTETPIVLTEIECDGIIGFGEASMPPYLGEDHRSALLFLSKAALVLKQFTSPLNLENILQEIDKIEKRNTAAKAAVDIALHDLKGKILNKPCYRLWDLDKAQVPLCTYTIGMDKPEVLKLKVKT